MQIICLSKLPLDSASVFYFLLLHNTYVKTYLFKTVFVISVSVGQEIGWAGWFCLRISGEITFHRWPEVPIWRLAWGWRIHFQDGHSHVWQVSAGTVTFLPQSPLPRLTSVPLWQGLASSRAGDPWESNAFCDRLSAGGRGGETIHPLSLPLQSTH